ncbi:DUF2913 family protein [Yersinia intermedia]|uniref:DUF2913 family protein n=1 Tax=Yersinia intermedia TaxID=631 RepID=UPI0005E650B3|nr:DUF2913 family protein [Yersinia intermedia]CND47524.1 Protein of uncharacterised function (DUF2913) [Yersinia intermedia]
MNNKVTTAEISHLAFCALVALHLADQETPLTTPTAENVFLVRWLAKAQKQRRFSKNVAIDIQWLLSKGQQQGGLTGQLKLHLEYLWFACSGQPEQQSDLFRLSYAMEALKARGWEHRVINERKKEGSKGQPHMPQRNKYHIQKNDLECCFTADGEQYKTLFLRITGNINEFVEVLTHHSFKLDVCTTFSTYRIVALLPLIRTLDETNNA